MSLKYVFVIDNMNILGKKFASKVPSKRSRFTEFKLRAVKLKNNLIPKVRRCKMHFKHFIEIEFTQSFMIDLNRAAGKVIVTSSCSWKTSKQTA